MKIEIKNLKKEFEGNMVFKNINLILESGKIYGFKGRNGSGKSVLFKIISGFYQPTEGSVLYNGHNIHKAQDFLPDTRVLIEKPSFIADLTGLENLKSLAQIKNIIGEKEIHKSLDVVNLSKEDRLKRYNKYSLGMKQKIAIAQVIMENPKIMIFDEPFNGIEEETIIKIKDYFKELNLSDKIIILSSHNNEDLVELCDVIYEFTNFELKRVTPK